MGREVRADPGCSPVGGEVAQSARGRSSPCSRGSTHWLRHLMTSRDVWLASSAHCVVLYGGSVAIIG